MQSRKKKKDFDEVNQKPNFYLMRSHIQKLETDPGGWHENKNKPRGNVTYQIVSITTTQMTSNIV